MADSCKEMLFRWEDRPFNEMLSGVKRVVLDEELGGRGTFAKESFDAVISNLALHWVNDLPAVLRGLNQVLKPDGMLMASLLSEDSLYELRTSLQLAESERRGGISPRVSPLVKTTDMSSLLKQSKFNLVTIDVDEIVVDYPDLVTLLNDIELMGEQNSIARPPGPLTKDLLLATQAIYRSFHGNPDGTLPLTFRVMFMVGWKESASQPKPLERGSGKFDLKEVLG
jgi:NADH dehydrogenase [ubiquinone] 1 alpha subcomplex assembly factor 5